MRTSTPGLKVASTAKRHICSREAKGSAGKEAQRAARSDENGYVMMINEGAVVYLGIHSFKTPAAAH